MSERRLAPPSSSPDLSPLAAAGILTAIALVGFVWRCYSIGTRCLWYDEALSFYMSRYPLSDFVGHMADRNHPPVYFLILKAWIAVFGSSRLALRVPSLIFGELAIFGMYPFVVEALRGRTGSDGVRPPVPPRAREIGLWAAAFVALSTSQIRWSWEVRMYSLGAAFTVFLSWLLFRTLHARSGLFRLWLLYAVVALLFAYTHYFALFVIAAHGILVVGYLAVEARRAPDSDAAVPQPHGDSYLKRLFGHPQFRPAVLAGAIICVGWLPWVPIFLDQRESKIEVRDWQPPPDWKAARTYAYHLLIEPEAYVPPEATGTALYCAIICVAIPLALLWRARAVDWCVILSAALPIGLSFVASYFFDMRIFYSRYFLFAQLFILAGAALVIGRSRFPWERVAIGSMLVLVMAGLDMRYIRSLNLSKYPSYAGLVAFIDAERQPSEPVIVCYRHYYLSVLYQAGDAPGWYMFGKDPDPVNDAHMAMGAEHVKRQEDLEAITGGRVWVVNTAAINGRSFKVDVPTRWVLKNQTNFADRYGMGPRNLEVLEYEVPPAVEESR